MVALGIGGRKGLGREYTQGEGGSPCPGVSGDLQRGGAESQAAPRRPVPWTGVGEGTAASISRLGRSLILCGL